MNNLTLNLTDFFSAKNLGSFFIKSFSIVFALLFVTYAIVTYKQTQEISRTVQNPRNRIILLVSLLQILTGVFLLAFAIFLV